MTLWRAAATCFYIGKLPFAPGSWGSLGAMVLWLFLPLSYFAHLTVILILFTLGVYASKKVAEDLNDNDPSEVVIDEAVGMGISLSCCRIAWDYTSLHFFFFVFLIYLNRPLFTVFRIFQEVGV